MMQDVQMELNPGLSWQKHHSKNKIKKKNSFHPHIGLEFKKETSNMFNVEHCSVW